MIGHYLYFDFQMSDCNIKTVGHGQWPTVIYITVSEDVIIKQESKLQHFLRTSKNNKCLDNAEYEKIYPSGSSPAKIYGSPKMHKPFDSLFSTFVLLFLPLVLTITIFPNTFVNSFLLIYQMNFAKKICSHLWRS